MRKSALYYLHHTFMALSFLRGLSTYLGNVFRWLRTHKFLTVVIVLALAYGAYWGYGKLTSTSGETTYTLGTVASSTIVSSISATGQIAASDSVNISAKVSGDITGVYVKEGQKVGAGQALFSIDSTDARNKVIQAENSLATSKLQFQKDSAQAPIDYQKAQDTLAQDEQDLSDTYTDTYNTLSGVYLNLPAVMTGTQDALYGYQMSSNKSQWNLDVLVNLFQNQEARAQAEQFADKAKADYQSARVTYDAAVDAYKSTSRTSGRDTLEKLLQDSYDMTTSVAQVAQSELNFLNTVSDLAQSYNIQLPTYFSTLSSNERTYLSTANTQQSNLASQKKALTTAKQAVVTDEQNITLLQVGNTTQGTNPISLQVSAANIAAAEQNLQQLKDALADYTVRAPFGGTVATVSASKGDTSSGTLATMVTTQQLAQLSVNEVDAAKIRVGQKATLTYDAIDDLTMTGKVASIDTVGTVSQGVVSYTIKIALDTQDTRVKPGMTVNASIITDTRADVLAVPSSAIKTTGGRSYVLEFEPPVALTQGSNTYTTAATPQQIQVTTGISDDTSVEITSGLTLGEQIVIKSSSAAAQTTTSTNRNSSFGGPGIRL